MNYLSTYISRVQIMKLRTYQHDAVEATLNSLRRGCNPVVAVPTGGGKSAIAAALVDRFRSKGGYTLLLTHNRELISQNYKTLGRYSNTDGVGVYCAGLGRRDVGSVATYASIQSIYTKLDILPEPDILCIDECQLVTPSDSNAKMYNAVLSRFHNARRIGLSATPYRYDTGLVYKGEGCWFDDLAIDIKFNDLVTQKYLSPLVGILTATHLELEEVDVTNGDYDSSQVDALITEQWLKELLRNVINLATDRRAWIMFSPSVRVAALSARIASEMGVKADFVYGGDSGRFDKLKRWEAGETTLMVNCQILTTGYDRPDIDVIIDCAPTESLGKHIQKLGRGARIADGKKNCLVIDACGNLQRLGSISQEDNFYRQKPNGETEPGEIIPRKSREPRRVLPGVRSLVPLDPTSGEQARDGAMLTLQVHATSAVVLATRRNPQQPSIMVKYACTTPEGARIDASYFVEPENPTDATENFFNNRRLAVRLPCPASKIIWAVRNAPAPAQVIARKSGRYWNVQCELP
jgi:superfamily II DNA or RNA helicase